MSYTQTDLDNIKSAIASGELMITLADGRTVRYRSISELRSAQRAIEAELAADSGGNLRRRGVVTTTTKGVC